MTATIVQFPRPHLRLVAAVREAQYRAAVAEGYVPKVLAIPEQRVQCVKPVRVVESNYADVHDTKGWL